MSDYFREGLPGDIYVRDGRGAGDGRSITLPDCTEARRGQRRRLEGGAGEADSWVICEKDDADAYAWTVITPAATASPLTTKGDLWGYDTDDARVPVGNDGEYLVADSSDAQGVSWQTVSLGTEVIEPYQLESFDSTVWTNMPAGQTIYSDGVRTDLADATEARFVFKISTAGSANAKLKVMYSTDGSTLAELTSPALSVAINGTGFKDTGWQSLVVGAQTADIYLHLVGVDGNNSADPYFYNTTCLIKRPVFGAQGPAGSGGGGGSLVDLLMLGGM